MFALKKQKTIELFYYPNSIPLQCSLRLSYHIYGSQMAHFFNGTVFQLPHFNPHSPSVPCACSTTCLALKWEVCEFCGEVRQAADHRQKLYFGPDKIKSEIIGKEPRSNSTTLTSRSRYSINHYNYDKPSQEAPILLALQARLSTNHSRDMTHD